MTNNNKNIPKFTNIKELLYHSATVFSSNVAFTEKVKKDITKYNKKQLIKYRRTNIGFVFQFYNLIQNLTVI